LVVFIQAVVGWCLGWVELIFNSSKTPAGSNLCDHYQIL
jgi:hypothetical protein